MFCYNLTPSEIRKEKGIKREKKGNYATNILQQENLYWERRRKSTSKGLWARPKQVPLLFKAAVLELRELICSNHRTSMAERAATCLPNHLSTQESSLFWLHKTRKCNKSKLQCILCIFTHLLQFLCNRIKAFVFRLCVGKDISYLLQFCLQLHNLLHVVFFFGSWFLNQGLLSALSICCYLLVVGMGLSKSLGQSENTSSISKPVILHRVTSILNSWKHLRSYISLRQRNITFFYTLQFWGQIYKC